MFEKEYQMEFDLEFQNHHQELSNPESSFFLQKILEYAKLNTYKLNIIDILGTVKPHWSFFSCKINSL